MTLLRKLAIVFAVSLFLAYFTIGYVEKYGSVVLYIHWTSRILVSVTATAWIAVWWFSSDRLK